MSREQRNYVILKFRRAVEKNEVGFEKVNHAAVETSSQSESKTLDANDDGSSPVFDEFIGLEPVAFQRGIDATRLAGGVCQCVGRTCDGHSRS